MIILLFILFIAPSFYIANIVKKYQPTYYNIVANIYFTGESTIMNENEVLRGRLSDLANAAYTQNRYTYTNFLSAEDIDVFYSNMDELSFVGYKLFGGREGCERVMIAFGNESDCGYEPTFPIAIVKAAAVQDKFSEDLNHRDFLGALMNLGIEREMIGDILVAESSKTGKHSAAYIFCAESIADYIVESLTRIRHTNMRCSICSPEDTGEIQLQKKPMHIIAASARADAVTATITGLSRSSTSLLFREKKFTLNNRLYENSSYQLKSGDIFSIRGYGKYEFVESGTVTRKGRLNIELLKYV